MTYTVISEKIRQKIIGGEFSTEKLPSERYLANHYKVNRLTLRKALNKLEKENYIYRINRKGAFIGSRADTLKDKNIIFLAFNAEQQQSLLANILFTFSQSANRNKFNITFLAIENIGEVCSILKETIINTSASYIIAGGNITEAAANTIMAAGTPVVFIGETADKSKSGFKENESSVNAIANEVTSFLTKRNEDTKNAYITLSSETGRFVLKGVNFSLGR